MNTLAIYEDVARTGRLYSLARLALTLNEARVWNDPELAKNLVYEYMGLANDIADIYATTVKNVDPDDLHALAYQALVRAAERYDVSKHKEFKAYAGRIIRNELNRAYTTERDYARRHVSIDAPTSDEDDAGMHERIPDASEVGKRPGSHLEKSELVQLVRDALETIDDQFERDALETVIIGGKTVREAEPILGRNRSSIVYAYQRAFDKLRAYLAQHGVSSDSIDAF